MEERQQEAKQQKSYSLRLKEEQEFSDLLEENRIWNEHAGRERYCQNLPYYGRCILMTKHTNHTHKHVCTSEIIPFKLFSLFVIFLMTHNYELDMIFKSFSNLQGNNSFPI